jgi:hypothetical protein
VGQGEEKSSWKIGNVPRKVCAMRVRKVLVDYQVQMLHLLAKSLPVLFSRPLVTQARRRLPPRRWFYYDREACSEASSGRGRTRWGGLSESIETRNDASEDVTA